MCLRIFAFVLSIAFLFSPFQFCRENDQEAWKRVGFWVPDTPDSEIESTLFTHLVFGFLHMNPSSFEIISQSQQYLDSFSSTVKIKNPSLKTILSIYGAEDLSLMMSNAFSRQIFIQSSFNVAATYGFDGIDFFWAQNLVNQSDMNNMATFLHEWRQAANHHVNEEFILTATVPCSPYYRYNFSSIMYPVDSMQVNLNWVHLRTLYYTSPSNSSIAWPSALYDPSDGDASTDHFIREWISSGLLESKLVMGLPLFGFYWNLGDSRDHHEKGESAQLDGMIIYKEIKAAIQLFGGDSNFDGTYVGNYWTQGSIWIAFDGVEAIKEKVSYAKQSKLLGYYLWLISYDDNWELSRAANGEDKTRKKDKLKIIFIAVVAASVLLCGAIFFKLKRTTKAAKKSSSETDIETAEQIYANIPDLQVFSFSDIEEATNRFSLENKIGEGGFGLVYKGILPNDEKIAVKIRSKSSKQGFEEFKNEIILAARLQHVNLVRLLGFCTDKEEQMLVYEYMPNRSLDFYLFDPNEQHLLDWRQRVCIIEGVTQGLLYLQEYSRLTVIHRDLKPSNILLDYGMKPKITDFGMARAFKKDVHESTSGFVGTYGYIAPEYIKYGLWSIKSDVYSFGILLLQIISGKRISGIYGENNDLNLMEYAYKLRKEGKGMEFMEASLEDTNSECKLMRCLQVALLCVQNNAEDRPCMLQVSSMIRTEDSSVASPKQHAYSKLENDEGETVPFVQRSEICSQNETTMSPVLGR